MTHLSSMKTINKLVASLMVAAMFATAFFVSSHNASAATGTVTLSGGTITVSAANLSFTTKSLNGVSATATTGTLTLTVDDESAQHSGWTIQASMGRLTHTVNGDQLPAAFIGQGATVNVTDISGVTPTFTANVPFEETDYTFSAGATNYLSADTLTGEGSHQLAVLVNQDIPASAYAGTYSATLTVTITNGPPS